MLGIVSSAVLVYHLIFFSGVSFLSALVVILSSLVYFFMLVGVD